MWMFLAKEGKRVLGDIRAFQERDIRLTTIHRKLTVLSRLIFILASVTMLLAAIDIELEEIVEVQCVQKI